MNLSRNTSHKIVYLNFIATISIVLYHLNAFPFSCAQEGTRIYDIISNFWIAIGFTTLGFFFLLSGFLLYNNIEWKGYKTKISSRLQTLIPPFVIWNTIGWAYESL